MAGSKKGQQKKRNKPRNMAKVRLYNEKEELDKVWMLEADTIEICEYHRNGKPMYKFASQVYHRPKRKWAAIYFLFYKDKDGASKCDSHLFVPEQPSKVADFYVRLGRVFVYNYNLLKQSGAVIISTAYICCIGDGLDIESLVEETRSMLIRDGAFDPLVVGLVNANRRENYNNPPLYERMLELSEKKLGV